MRSNHKITLRFLCVLTHFIFPSPFFIIAFLEKLHIRTRSISALQPAVPPLAAPAAQRHAVSRGGRCRGGFERPPWLRLIWLYESA